MDKAIEALEALLEPDADDRVDYDDSAILCGKCGNKKWVYIAEALSELTVYKAKLEGQGKCPPDCKQQDHCLECSRLHADQYAIQLRELAELEENQTKEANK